MWWDKPSLIIIDVIIQLAGNKDSIRIQERPARITPTTAEQQVQVV
jgi:hypothetical protein